jgi:hypothetical protein
MGHIEFKKIWRSLDNGWTQGSWKRWNLGKLRKLDNRLEIWEKIKSGTRINGNKNGNKNVGKLRKLNTKNTKRGEKDGIRKHWKYWTMEELYELSNLLQVHQSWR